MVKGMKISSIGWLILGAIAIVWEVFGLTGVGSITPLTQDVYHLENHYATAGAWIAAVLVWLGYHFLVQRHNPKT